MPASDAEAFEGFGGPGEGPPTGVESKSKSSPLPHPTTISLRTAHNVYISARGNLEGWRIVQAGAPRDCETFSTVPIQDGSARVSLKTFHSDETETRYISVEKGEKPILDNTVTQSSSNDTDWQKFDLVQIGDGDMVAVRCIADNSYLSAAATGQFFHRESAREH